MSKSRGNYIGLTDSPGEQFGKVMSIPDQALPQWMRLVTDWPASQAEELIASMASGALHPMEAKKQLGHRIVELYHGSRAADVAQHAFERTHQLGEQPDVIPEVTLDGLVRLSDLLVGIGAASSNSDARRFIAGRGVSLDGQKASSGELVIDTAVTIKVGSRRFTGSSSTEAPAALNTGSSARTADVAGYQRNGAPSRRSLYRMPGCSASRMFHRPS
jgi:tyrosyl-tRNA synthetase